MSKDTTRSSEIYDVTAKQKEIIEWHAQQRLKHRQQFLKEVHNPNAHAVVEGHVFDAAVQRHYATIVGSEKFFRPTTLNFLWACTFTLGLIAITDWRVKVFRGIKEEMFRTGQVSYRDRQWKFV